MGTRVSRTKGKLHRVNVTMPEALKVACERVASSAGASTSGLVKQAIVSYLTHEVVPALQVALDKGSTSTKLSKLRLLAHIRAGITAHSAPGRHRSSLIRCAYMRYCRTMKREGTKRKPFATWKTTFNELTLLTANEAEDYQAGKTP